VISIGVPAWRIGIVLFVAVGTLPIPVDNVIVAGSGARSGKHRTGVTACDQ